MKNAFVLLAAGSSQRFKSEIKKQFYEFNGKPCFIYPLLSALKSALFSTYILVIDKEDEEKTKGILKREGLENVIIVNGSKTRNASVKHALFHLKEENPTIVYIHDSARPVLPVQLLLDLNEEMKGFEAVAPALSVSDSLIKGEEYLNRDEIFRIQTPQVFSYKAILKIYQTGFDEKSTDDYSKAIEANLKRKLIPGSPLLYKLTYLSDIPVIKSLLM